MSTAEQMLRITTVSAEWCRRNGHPDAARVHEQRAEAWRKVVEREKEQER